MIIKCCFLFLQDNSMYYYNIRYINIFVLKCIFLIICAGGGGLGAWSDFPSFLSLADHMPEKVQKNSIYLHLFYQHLFYLLLHYKYFYCNFSTICSKKY